MNVFALILQLMPSIFQQIIAIQQAFHSQPGPAKKAMAIENVAAAHPDITFTPEVKAATAATIDQLVTGLKVAAVAGFTPPTVSPTAVPKAPATGQK